MPEVLEDWTFEQTPESSMLSVYSVSLSQCFGGLVSLVKIWDFRFGGVTPNYVPLLVATTI